MMMHALQLRIKIVDYGLHLLDTYQLWVLKFVF